MTAMIVIIVVFLTSRAVGHATRFISARTSCKNCPARSSSPARGPLTPRSRRAALPSCPSPKRAARGAAEPAGASDELMRAEVDPDPTNESSLPPVILSSSFFNTRLLPSGFSSGQSTEATFPKSPATVTARTKTKAKVIPLSVSRCSHGKRVRLWGSGVPGFEPGLSVLETDVLTIDTIPLKSGVSR